MSTFALIRENAYANIRKLLLALSFLPLKSQEFFLKNILFPTSYHEKFQTHRKVERFYNGLQDSHHLDSTINISLLALYLPSAHPTIHPLVILCISKQTADRRQHFILKD